MKDRVLGLLSIIRKANKMTFAKDILDGFKYGKIHYVFVATDASDKTKERFLKKCAYYKCHTNLHYKSEDLSKAIGRQNIMTIGITDRGFAKAIIEKEGGEYGQTSKTETKQ